MLWTSCSPRAPALKICIEDPCRLSEPGNPILLGMKQGVGEGVCPTFTSKPFAGTPRVWLWDHAPGSVTQALLNNQFMQQFLPARWEGCEWSRGCPGLACSFLSSCSSGPQPPPPGPEGGRGGLATACSCKGALGTRIPELPRAAGGNAC